MHTSEEWTRHPSLQHVPIANTPLSQDYLQGFSLLGGSIFLGLDVIAMQRIGLSSVMLNTLVQFTLNDMRPLIALCIVFGKDEISAVNYLLPVKQFMGLGLHVSLYCMLLGWSTDNILFFTMGYLFAQLFQTLLKQVFTVAGARFFPHDKTSSTYQFATSVSHHMGYMGGTLLWMYGAPRIARLFQGPSDESLLNDRELCQVYSERCQKAALRELGLNADASDSQVRDRWRELLKKHPDKLHSSTEVEIEFGRITNARRRLRELEPPMEKSNSLPRPEVA